MKKLCLVSIILCTFLSCKQAAKTNYSAIEKGLIPAVLVGDSTVTYSVEERMKDFQVPGVSVAVFKNGEIVWRKAYGETKAGSGNKVTPETRFQAASISKSVTGLGVLKLVEDYQLDLDTDINQYLSSWKIQSPFLKEEKVTIRKLLTHTAGTNISGIMGYDKSDTIPGTTDILNGKGDTPPVKLDTIPGTRFFYSGGGFIILQQLIEDVSGSSFKGYFEKVVFLPLGMSHSTFDQVPKENVSSAHGWDGDPYPQGWRVFPSMAAAGLWTTPSDLAKFCFAIEDAYHGKEGAFISQKLANEMLTPIKKRGLGVALETEKEVPFFFHGGSNPGGFRSFMVDAYKQRTGIVVMVNAEQGHIIQDDILRSFSNFFSVEVKEPRHIQPVNMGREELKKFTGNYQLKEEMEYPLEVSIGFENKLILYDPNDGMRNTYMPLNDSTFIEMNSGLEISFTTDSQTGKIKSMDFSGMYTFYKVY
jgi:CubicO group peptidase (beta-lactamase class C family)